MIKQLIFSLFHIQEYRNRLSIKQRYYSLMFSLAKNPNYLGKYFEVY
jgi:hypothetical protein